ncbi:MAG: ATP-binding cassette domain-containing protein [Planctomycetota bacterium]|jgi:peptide/nickel transport system ATP-binding protein
MSRDPLLSVQSLSVAYGNRTVVRDVSFDIEPGQTLGLVGESGSGKSTTGRAIVRLSRPSAGGILLDGRDIFAMSAAEQKSTCRRIQIVFQDTLGSLNPRMSLGQCIAEPLTIHGRYTRHELQDRTVDALQRVALGAEHAARFPHEISGGQRQRVCIARALMLKPDLLICDEAVSALDVSIQADILALLGRLQRDMGLAYLFISHDLAVVRAISHRIAVMYRGEIVEIGDASDVFDYPQHEYTRRLLAAIPRLARSAAGGSEPRP